MTFRQELNSWLFPSAVKTSPIPQVGSTAPFTPQLPFPRPQSKPTIVTFLRHCGCPFAEKTFLDFRKVADANPEVECIAISHSEKPATDKWAEATGGTGLVEIIVDADKEIYPKWGLGVASLWHVLSPWTLKNVFTLGMQEKIWNRPTESGSRWQTAGSFAVDGNGVVKWVQVAQAADEIGDFEKALEVLTSS